MHRRLLPCFPVFRSGSRSLPLHSWAPLGSAAPLACLDPPYIAPGRRGGLVLETGGGSGRREAGLKQAAAGATGWGGGALLLPPWLPTSSCDVEQEREGAEEGGEKKAAEGAGWRDLCRARQGVQGPRIPIVFYWEEG